MTDEAPASTEAPLRERAAEEIRVILARKRMSGSELARRAGMKQPYLSRRLVGEVALDLDDLEVIARELGVTVAQLVSGTGAGEQTTARYGPITQFRGQDAEGLMPHQPNGQRGAIASTATTRRPARIAPRVPQEARLIGSEVVPA